MEKQALRSYLVETFMFGAPLDSLSDDASLLESGILDSTGVLELVLHLEEKYGITVDTTELLPEHFDSIARIQAFLERKGVARRA